MNHRHRYVADQYFRIGHRFGIEPDRLFLLYSTNSIFYSAGAKFGGHWLYLERHVE